MPVDDLVLLLSRGRLLNDLRFLGFFLSEGRPLQVLCCHRPAAAAMVIVAGVCHVAAANQGRVLSRLIGGEMSDQQTLAESRGVAIHDQHASRRPRQGDHLARTAHSVGVAIELTPLFAHAVLAPHPGTDGSWRWASLVPSGSACIGGRG